MKPIIRACELENVSFNLRNQVKYLLVCMGKLGHRWLELCLPLVWCQTIIWTNAGSLLIGHLGGNFVKFESNHIDFIEQNAFGNTAAK